MSFLPGHFPGAAFAAPAILTELTQEDSATATAQTITGPASILAGDLLVLWDTAIDVGLPTETVPADFNIISSLSNGVSTRAILSYKKATGTEASASLTGMTGSNTRKAMYVFRGNIPITTVTPADAAGEITDGNPSAQVVNASSGVVPLVVLAGYRGAAASTIDPRSFSPAKDGEVSPSNGLYLAFKIYNTGPEDVTVDMEDEGNGNALASCYIECT